MAVPSVAGVTTAEAATKPMFYKANVTGDVSQARCVRSREGYVLDRPWKELALTKLLAFYAGYAVKVVATSIYLPTPQALGNDRLVQRGHVVASRALRSTCPLLCW